VRNFSKNRQITYTSGFIGDEGLEAKQFSGNLFRKIPTKALSTERETRKRNVRNWLKKINYQAGLSSAIGFVDYDLDAQVLTITYKAGWLGTGGAGGTYKYFGVPLQRLQQMHLATSLGHFVSGYIKPYYSFVRV
jgi:hypothetical protein